MPSPTSSAAFKINGTTIADIATASVTINRQQIDVTALGDTYRKHEEGMLEGTVQIEMFLDSSHSSVLSAISNGTALTNAGVFWTSGNSIVGNAYVQEMSVSVAANGVAQANATLLFSGSSITVT